LDEEEKGRRQPTFVVEANKGGGAGVALEPLA
jgi:hypothetical protein